MVTRVIGIPDSNEIIRIACGGDIIEIQIPGNAGPAGGGVQTTGSSGGSLPTTNPLKDPFAAIVQEMGENPFKLPTAYIMPRTITGRLDTTSIVKQVLDQIADTNRANPRAVILDVSNVNLHELSDLGKKLSYEAPDIPIAIDFGGTLKR